MLACSGTVYLEKKDWVFLFGMNFIMAKSVCDLYETY